MLSRKIMYFIAYKRCQKFIKTLYGYFGYNNRLSCPCALKTKSNESY